MSAHTAGSKYQKRTKLDQYCCIKVCCPLHRSAPMLLEAAKELLAYIDLGEPTRYVPAADNLRKALTLAEGQDA